MSTGSKTTVETTTDKHTYRNSAAAAHAIQAAPPVSVLNSLILPTFKDLKVAQYRIAAETREGQESAGTEFRVGQSTVRQSPNHRIL